MNKLQNALDSLHLKSDEEILELLPNLLSDLNYENKIELMSDILCEEWHLTTHHEFIKSVLDIFAKSLQIKN
jgi:hypothetical protein